MIARVARERGTTYILLGRPRERRGFGRLSEPLGLQLVRDLPGVDVRIVADSSNGLKMYARLDALTMRLPQAEGNEQPGGRARESAAVR